MVRVLTWNESFSVGHAALDQEHSGMIDAINAVCDSMSDAAALAEQLQRLEVAVAHHFDHEDEILKMVVAEAEARRYGGDLANMGRAVISEHILDHARDLRGLRALIANRTAGLCDDLGDWFINHAVKQDAHLKGMFQALDRDLPGLRARLPR